MLRVVSDTADRALAPFRATAAPASFGAGFYEQERDDIHLFRWMQTEGELEFEPLERQRFLEFWAFSCFFDLTQELEVGEPDWQQRKALSHGWCRLSVPVPAGADRVRLRLNKPFPPSFYPEDSRTLAIRVRLGAYLHEDRERHRQIEGQYDNKIENWREMLAGKTALESTPSVLGIDMYGVCNVKPPCVYCDWDKSKSMEGENVDTPFTRATLEGWGDIFSNSSTLVNCSIGEPFMMKNLDELFDIFGDQGKALEMTTNGQILTDRNIEKLLDREIDLYISLDAATPETYARLRNDTFDKILGNLRRLISAKGGRGGLPRVHLVFMPMKCNVHELEPFIELCNELQVDRLVLRPLNYSDAIALKWERQGYVFDYPKELLPFEELIRVSARAARACAERGVPLSDQLDFGASMEEMFSEEFRAGVQTGPEPLESPSIAAGDPAPAAVSPPLEQASGDDPNGGADADASLGEEKLPACLEPWTSLYVLRRGVLPCCYGGHPIDSMDGFGRTWNSTIVQEIRAELAAGRFHRYCLRSPACPIVRKDEHAGALPRSQAIFLRGRALLQRIDRRLFGIPGRIYRPSKRAAKRLYAAVADSASAGSESGS